MGYECVMCMELLEAPAPASLVSTPSTSRKPSTKEDLTAICATVCGHMFHRACLNCWFHQKMKKECPSCRKLLTPGKIFRLYPPASAPEDGISNYVNKNGFRLTEIEERSLPQTHCPNNECTQLYEIHRLLVSDYNKLRDTANGHKEKIDISTAQIKSLEEECTRLKNVHLGQKYASSSSDGGCYKMKKCASCNKYTRRTYSGQDCRFCKPESKPGSSKDLNLNSSNLTPVTFSTLPRAEMTKQVPTRGSIGSKPAPVFSQESSIFDLSVNAESLIALPIHEQASSTSMAGRNLPIYVEKINFSSSMKPVASASNHGSYTFENSHTRITLNTPTRVIATTKRQPMWTCSTCFMSNQNVAQNCSICDGRKPGVPSERLIPVSLVPNCSKPVTSVSASASSAPLLDGDAGRWICSMCMIPNDPKVSACWLCSNKNPNSKKKSTSDIATTTTSSFNLIDPTLNLGGTTAVSKAVSTAATSSSTLDTALFSYPNSSYTPLQNSENSNWAQTFEDFQDLLKVVPATPQCIQTPLPITEQCQQQFQGQTHNQDPTNSNFSQNSITAAPNQMAWTNSNTELKRMPNVLPNTNPGTNCIQNPSPSISAQPQQQFQGHNNQDATNSIFNQSPMTSASNSMQLTAALDVPI